MEVEVVTLENGKEYGIVKEINNYLLLVNPENELDYCIRKNVVKNGEEFIETLESDEDFDKALDLFSEYFKK